MIPLPKLLRSLALGGLALALRAQSDDLSQLSRYLSGAAPTAGKLVPLVKEKAFEDHTKAMQKAWSNAAKDRLEAMRHWGPQELKATRSESLVFYPFGGPDWLHVRTLLPWGKTYVLLGLEPVGRIPDLTKLEEDERALELKRLRVSLSDSLSLSFFRTLGMKKDLKERAMVGVLPIFFTAAGYLGDEIRSIERIGLDPDGSVRPAKGTPSGVKLTFVPKGETEARTLYYFSWNLANPALKGKGGAILEFVHKLGRTHTTFLKSASYLMHEPFCTRIRDFILEHAHYLVQDDSGIPHKHLPADRWSAQPYGVYLKPIPLFKHRLQPELQALYEQSKPIKPLPFGTGYRYKGQGKESNVVVYTRK